MRVRLIALTMLLVAGCVRAGTPIVVQPPASTPPAPVPVRTFAGSFELRPALTFYVVNSNGRDFQVRLKWRDDRQIYADRPRLIRVFDPQEILIVRHDEPCERVPPGADIPAYDRTLAVRANGAGVYQVVVTAMGGPLEFATVPPLSYGVASASKLTGRGDQFQNAYIYLPPGLESLPVRVDGSFDALTLHDESGVSRLEFRAGSTGTAASVPPTGPHVWKLSIASRGEYRLDFNGLPIILCPDAPTARAIRGSVDVLEDGTICFHKFQIKAQQVLKRYRQLPGGVFNVHVPPLAQYRNEWLKAPARHDLLLGGPGVYAALPAVLQAQNLDPTSPLFGTINQRPSTNPWRSYTRLGLIRVAEHAAMMAAVYAIPDSFNPLHKNAVLRHRVIIAAMQELMLLREHEMPIDSIGEEFFGGIQAFTFSGFLRCYPLLVQDCPPDVREVWTQGLRRYADRMAVSQVASTFNQQSVIMVGLLHFAQGSGDATYHLLLQRHLHWMYTRNQWDMGQMPAGYYFDGGVDSTYAGITLHNLAFIYEQIRDATLLESIRRCIDLFNHTIVPQPNGTLLGVSSFACRTPGDWTEAQAGAGLAMLADDLPEAAPLSDRLWPTLRATKSDLATRREVEQALSSRLSYLDVGTMRDEGGAGTILMGAELHFSIWQFFATAPRRGELPVVAQREFTRNFGDEFFCVRRPSYYAFIYAGKPMPEWLKDQRPRDPRAQHPRNGGGICLFWSPAFGASLLAKNWSAYAAQTIIAEHKAGGADWEDYWSVANSFDADRAQATVKGRIMNQPIEFQRQYRFERDRVECNLKLSASDHADVQAMWECFPYPADASLHLQVSLVDEANRPVNNRPASAIVFRNGSHEAHVIAFAQPRVCRFGKDRSVDHYGKPREHGRVLAELPATWTPGQSHSVRWSVLAVPSDQVANAIRESIAAMNR